MAINPSAPIAVAFSPEPMDVATLLASLRAKQSLATLAADFRVEGDAVEIARSGFRVQVRVLAPDTSAAQMCIARLSHHLAAADVQAVFVVYGSHDASFDGAVFTRGTVRGSAVLELTWVAVATTEVIANLSEGLVLYDAVGEGTRLFGLEYQPREGAWMHIHPAAPSTTGTGAETPVEACNFSIRVANGLERSGLRTLGEVAALSADEANALPNVGRRGLEELRLVLSEHGLDFRPNSPEKSG